MCEMMSDCWEKKTYNATTFRAMAASSTAAILCQISAHSFPVTRRERSLGSEQVPTKVKSGVDKMPRNIVPIAYPGKRYRLSTRIRASGGTVMWKTVKTRRVMRYTVNATFCKSVSPLCWRTGANTHDTQCNPWADTSSPVSVNPCHNFSSPF